MKGSVKPVESKPNWARNCHKVIFLIRDLRNPICLTFKAIEVQGSPTTCEHQTMARPVWLHPQPGFSWFINLQNRFNGAVNQLVWYGLNLKTQPKKPRVKHGLDGSVWFVQFY